MAIGSAKAEVSVLLVDDDRDDFVLTRDLLAEIVGSRFRLDWISNCEQGLDCVCSGKYDVILLDHSLGSMTGLELLAQAREKGCDAPIIIFTGLADPNIDAAAMKYGVGYETFRLFFTVSQPTHACTACV